MHVYLKADYDSYQRRTIDFISIYFFVYALNLFVKIIVRSFAAWDYISMGVLGLLFLMTFISMPKAIKARLVCVEIIALILSFCLS